MKKISYLLIVLGEIIVFLLIKSNIKLHCLSKLLFKTPCPGCGLTRGFRELLKLNIIKAINYNILVIPIIIFLIILNILIVIDLIKNTNKVELFINKIIKYPIIIILLLIITEILNIYHGV